MTIDRLSRSPAPRHSVRRAENAKTCVQWSDLVITATTTAAGYIQIDWLAAGRRSPTSPLMT
jgi:ornithine cyclodeaminase/alanine dehydrogenase-like protein (mu-crystallin family)